MVYFRCKLRTPKAIAIKAFTPAIPISDTGLVFHNEKTFSFTSMDSTYITRLDIKAMIDNAFMASSPEVFYNPILSYF